MLIQSAQNAAQLPHNAQFFGLKQHFFATCSRGVDVDSREDSAVGKLARQTQFHVARTLELFEDHLVHLRAGLNKSRGDDGQRSALAQVTCATKELLRRVERRGVNTTGEDSTRGRSGEVVGTGKPGD